MGIGTGCGYTTQIRSEAPITGIADDEAYTCLVSAWVRQVLLTSRYGHWQAWCLRSRGTPETHAGVGGLALRPSMLSAVLSGWTHPASPGVGRSWACSSSSG